MIETLQILNEKLKKKLQEMTDKENLKTEKINQIKMMIEEDFIKEVAEVKLQNIELIDQLETVAKEKSLMGKELEQITDLQNQLEKATYNNRKIVDSMETLIATYKQREEEKEKEMHRMDRDLESLQHVMRGYKRREKE